MGFKGFISPGPAAQIDAGEVFTFEDTLNEVGIAGSVAGPFTITASTLDGAAGIMFVHNSPRSVSQGRVRVSGQMFAATGVIAREVEWGEFPEVSPVDQVRFLWRLPVVLPVFGGDVTLTLNNPGEGAIDASMKGYALRGDTAALAPRPVTRGVFYPKPPTGTKTGLQIPVIPPEYTTAQLTAIASGGGTPDLSILVRPYSLGDFDARSVAVPGTSYSATPPYVLATDTTANVGYISESYPVAGLNALRATAQSNLVTPPDNFGITVTLKP